jgi:hypothetical protein
MGNDQTIVVAGIIAEGGWDEETGRLALILRTPEGDRYSLEDSDLSRELEKSSGEEVVIEGRLVGEGDSQCLQILSFRLEEEFQDEEDYIRPAKFPRPNSFKEPMDQDERGPAKPERRPQRGYKPAWFEIEDKEK